MPNDAPKPNHTAARCCACGGACAPCYITLLTLRGPTPGRGWGCVVCKLPPDGAYAVTCGACIAAKRPLTHACAGYADDPARVPIDTLNVRFDHDLARHTIDLANPPTI